MKPSYPLFLRGLFRVLSSLVLGVTNLCVSRALREWARPGRDPAYAFPLEVLSNHKLPTLGPNPSAIAFVWLLKFCLFVSILCTGFPVCHSLTASCPLHFQITYLAPAGVTLRPLT